MWPYDAAEALKGPEYITLPEEVILEVQRDPAKMVEQDPSNGRIKFSEEEAFPGKKAPNPEKLRAFKRVSTCGKERALR